MNILYLTQWFDPEPFFKGSNYVKKIRERDEVDSIQIITGFPNYPGGKLYDGYKIKLWQNDLINNVSVIRSALYPSHSNSPIGRIINYLSFVLSSIFTALFNTHKFDIIYVYHPPITIGLTALVLKMIFKKPYVYEIQDLWPDTLKSTGMINNRFLLNIMRGITSLIYKNADSIIVISPGFKDVLIKRGINSDKISVIYNCCDEKNIYPLESDEELSIKLNLKNTFNIMFAGNMGKAQALDSVLDAAKIVSKELKDIKFVFIGGGVNVDKLKTKSVELNLTNTIFLNAVPTNEIGKYFSIADVMLVHLKKDPLFKITIPGKTQAYLAAAKPIIMCVEGNAAELIVRAKAGLTCTPEDATGLANTIVEMYNMPRNKILQIGLNGERFYNGELALDVGLKKLMKVFCSTLNNEYI